MDMAARTQPRNVGTHLLVETAGQYAVRLANSNDDLSAAQVLRFEVFNLELNEGLAESFATGRDADPFDPVCDHLLVEHQPDRQVVGTYRLQTGNMATANRGYYSAQEFDFAPYERFRDQMVEVGRACVHRAHRNLTVLGLLWKGIAGYARRHGSRYLIGCSSLTSQDPAVGASAYSELCRKYLVNPEFRTRPFSHLECPLSKVAEDAPKIPKLLRAYLSIGAKICGPPAIDRVFKTIDFLTWLDRENMPALTRARFFG
jgi:putative hemolysin